MLRFIFKCLKFLRPPSIRRRILGASHQIRPLKGAFFIEHVDETGEIQTERVNAHRLVLRDGRVYLDGWFEMMPSFRSVPVDRIKCIVDDAGAGEIVPPDDVSCWLNRRSLR